LHAMLLATSATVFALIRAKKDMTLVIGHVGRVKGKRKKLKGGTSNEFHMVE